jgi:hypothetical protein
VRGIWSSSLLGLDIRVRHTPSIFLFLVDGRSSVLGKRRFCALVKTGSELHQAHRCIFSYVDIRPPNFRPRKIVLVNIHRSARNSF